MVGVVAEIFDGDRVVDCMEHVFVGDTVAARRSVDFHMVLLYYKICQAEGRPLS